MNQLELHKVCGINKKNKDNTLLCNKLYSNYYQNNDLYIDKCFTLPETYNETYKRKIGYRNQNVKERFHTLALCRHLFYYREKVNTSAYGILKNYLFEMNRFEYRYEDENGEVYKKVLYGSICENHGLFEKSVYELFIQYFSTDIEQHISIAIQDKLAVEFNSHLTGMYNNLKGAKKYLEE